VAVALVCVGQVAYGDIARPNQVGTSAQLPPDRSEDWGGGSPRGTRADWSEDWEAYPNGSSMHGLGGWQGWDNDPTWTGWLQEVIFRSPDSALDSNTTTDLVHPFSGHQSGVWHLYAYQYVPSGLNAPNGQYFIVEKEYNDLGPYQWSIQMWVATDGTVHCDCGAADNGTPGVMWIPDAWNEIHAIIDLDNDWVQLFYNGTLMGAYQWTAGVFGNDTGCPAAGCIGAIDLYAYDGSSVYYDDLELTSAETSWDHKMHFPQLPDPTGWDVKAGCLEDDWECSETGYVTDIHFWGSWHGDMVEDIEFL
jgi:hypothetical protein